VVGERRRLHYERQRLIANVGLRELLKDSVESIASLASKKLF
jgi:hypothetical protein